MGQIRLLVCGGRDYSDTARFDIEITKELYWLLGNPAWMPTKFLDSTLVLIHGGARGADKLADNFGVRYGIYQYRFPADWDEYKLAAGPIRNTQMLVEGKPTHGLVFPGGKGTLDMMTKLFKAGIPFRFVGK